VGAADKARASRRSTRMGRGEANPLGGHHPRAPGGWIVQMQVHRNRFQRRCGLRVSDGRGMTSGPQIHFQHGKGTARSQRGRPNVPPPIPATRAFIVVSCAGQAAHGRHIQGFAIGNKRSGRLIYATELPQTRASRSSTAPSTPSHAGRVHRSHLPARCRALRGSRNINRCCVRHVRAAGQDARTTSGGGRGGGSSRLRSHRPPMRRLITGGRLDAPWGLALGAANFA